jgi:predicted ArsR family transcriptional regulator
MASSGESDELFDTTRGKVLLLMCGGPLTVNDLSDALRVTDNAVRAQLTNLQSGGLVRQLGLRPGTRKPHVEYELTPKGRSLMPGAYEPVLRALIDALRENLSADQLRQLAGNVARRLIGELIQKLQATPSTAAAGQSKLEHLQRLAAALPGVSVKAGGATDSLAVRACGCPLAAITADHPVVCEVIAEVLSDVLGADVRQRCDRTEWPQCCFEIRRR